MAAFVFDLETTALVPERNKNDLHQMKMSIGCGAFLDIEAGNAKTVQTLTILRFRGDEESDLKRLSDCMDSASTICIYNAKFDLGVLRNYYSEQKIEGWKRKTFDLFSILQKHFDTYPSLNSLCHYNRIEGKRGCGKDAPKLWEDGDIEKLFEYCEGDIKATASVLLLDELWFPRRLWGIDCIDLKKYKQLFREGYL